MLIEIAFVDDSDILRMSLSYLIEKLNPMYKIHQYCNGLDLISKLPEEKYTPRLFLMDISMPFINGYDATIWAKKMFSNTPVLAFTMFNNPEALIHMYNCGANGFICKNISPENLLLAIQEVLHGNFYCNLNCEYKVIGNTLYKNDQIIKPCKNLSEQEEVILKLIAVGKSYKQIAYDLSLSRRTVENHKNNISIKLDIYTKEGLLLYAIKTGLVPI